MNDLAQRNHQLKQANRILRLGYVVLGVVGIAGYAIAQAGPTPPGSTDPNSNEVRVDINKVGDAQIIAAVDHERGFAVLVDEEGKINVIHRDGTVIVPNRKHYSNQVDVKPSD